MSSGLKHYVFMGVNADFNIVEPNLRISWDIIRIILGYLGMFHGDISYVIKLGILGGFTIKKRESTHNFRWF